MTERLSTWMDGELKPEEARDLLPKLKRDFTIREDWACYHLIGDTIRGMDGSDLGARICAHLRTEPTVLLPPRSREKPEKLSRFALAMPAKVAAVAFVAFVGGMALQSLQQNAPAIEGNQTAVLADDRARGYLVDHLPYSNSKALQGTAMYASAARQ